LAHHYHDFFMTYDRPPQKSQQISGSAEQKNEKKEENKETKCSDTEK
jgi:hypothetical protein